MFRTALAALAPAVLMAAPAFAAPVTTNGGIVSIDYADLDLTHADGRAVLAKRVERAAETACQRPYIRDMAGQIAYRACVANVMSEARSQLSDRDLPETLALAAR